MSVKKKLITTSKFLSLVLRHKPETIDMQLDPEGWLPIDQLIEGANKIGKLLTIELLHEVVATNEKRRFALSDDGLRIRASQGHSIANVELNLVATEPPAILYHGTIANFLDSIRQQGLDKRSRNHVHLSDNRATAIKVGSRRGKPVILKIDSARMHAASNKFFLSANQVWLTDSVPTEFIEFPTSQAE